MQQAREEMQSRKELEDSSPFLIILSMLGFCTWVLHAVRDVRPKSNAMLDAAPRP